jgi:hypothetical protein
MCGRFTQYTPKKEIADQSALMVCYPVSQRVNDVRKDDELCAALLNLSLLDG